MRSQPLRLLAVVVFFAAVITIGNTSPARACSCMGPKTHEQYFADAEYAFNGVPTSVENLNGKTYTFSVGQAFKGQIPNPVKISTPSDGAACGTTFDIGTAYRVYAFKNGDLLSTNLCSGNATVASMSEPDDNVPTTTTTPKATTTTVKTTTTVEEATTTSSSSSTTPPTLVASSESEGGGVNGVLVAAVVVVAGGAIAAALALARARRAG